MKKQILAIGGMALPPDLDNLLLIEYFLGLTAKRKPKVAFIGTAHGDADMGRLRFYAGFSQFSCKPTHLPLFARTPRDLESFVLEQDAIYVGGGNTKSLLAVWRDWELDVVLREAWRQGIVLAGVSAGAICWFARGVTDSWADRLRPLECLGFLPAACCPHYDGEAERRPAVHDFVAGGIVPPVLALNDGAAAHFIGRRLHRIVTWKPTARAFTVRKRRGEVTETELPWTPLQPVQPTDLKLKRQRVKGTR
jgi:peptidase E